jgi:protein TonB
MKTRNEFTSFLASSSRKFFKVGLGASILLIIAAFKIPVYSSTPIIPNYENDGIIVIEYISQLVPVEKLIEQPKKIEPAKTPPEPISKPIVSNKVETQVEKKETTVETSSKIKMVLMEPVVQVPPVWKVVEKMPKFIGGESALYVHFGKEINYHSKAVEWGISGKVYIRFIVDKDGKIIKAEIAKGVHPLLDDEALRVVKNMPNWEPGVQNGERVKVSMVVPVSFVIK